MNLEKVSEYKCDKCRDITYIVEDGEARECECKALRDCEDILRRSGRLLWMDIKLLQDML